MVSSPAELQGTSVRAAFCHAVVQAVSQRSAEVRAAFQSALDDSVRARIESASRIGWTDGSDNLVLLEAIRVAAGDEAVREIGSDALATLIQSPLLSFARPAFRQKGRRIIVSLFPRAWEFILKGHGQAQVDQAEDQSWTRVTLVKLPMPIAASRGFQKVVQGFLERVMVTVDLEPDVEIDASSVSDETLTFMMRAPPV